MGSAPKQAGVAPDLESRLSQDHHDALRLWLRLLSCTVLIERRIRARLRSRFGITLARFDLLAQLDRDDEGLTMGELSRRLMVTGGNVTGLTGELVAEGLVRRSADVGDRRVQRVALTSRGRRMFRTMAAEHERWVVELVAGLPVRERERLHATLGRLKDAVRSVPEPTPAGRGARR